MCFQLWAHVNTESAMSGLHVSGSGKEKRPLGRICTAAVMQAYKSAVLRYTAPCGQRQADDMNMDCDMNIGLRT